MERVVYTSVQELHEDIHARIAAKKKNNPMSEIFLILENPLQGLLLRRQIVATSPNRALANLQMLTFDGLVAELSLRYLSKSIVMPVEATLDACSYSVMVSSPELGFGQSASLTTASAISEVYKLLRFTKDEKLIALSTSPLVSKTQSSVVKAVLEVRNVLQQKFGFANYPTSVENLSQLSTSDLLKDSLFLVFSDTIPATLSSFLESQPNCVNYTVDAKAENPRLRKLARYFTCPDPQTEAALAVSQVLGLISEGVHPYDIAVVFTNAQQYSGLLASAFEDAGINWHGALTTIGQSSRVYRGFNLILQMLAAKNSEHSGITRPLLMRLLESGNFSVSNLEVDTDLCRKFVRDKEIYGDALSWLKVLNSLARPKTKDLKAVEELRALLKALQKSLSAMAEAKSWGDFGQQLYSAVENFFVIGNEANLDEDELTVVRMFKEILLQEFPLMDKIKSPDHSGLEPSADSALIFIDRKIGQRRRRKGSLVSGVHISGLAEMQVLKFERIILVGATDGFLPSNFSESGFLSDRMLEELEELGRSMTATEDKSRILASHLIAALSHANPIVLRSRSGMIGKLDDVPSRYLDLSDISEVSQVEIKSYENLLDQELALPIASQEFIALLHSLEEPKTGSQNRTLKSLSVFREPKSEGYFGDLAGEEAESISVGELSASAIETFMDCEYRFFVTRMLGIYTSERRDILDNWRANDFGNLIHESMEAFLQSLQEQGSLPDGKSSFTHEETELFFSKYLSEGLEVFYAKGHDVWRPGFENHMARVKENLRDFFAREFFSLRESNALAVYASELSFGRGTAVEVTAQSSSGAIYKLSGRIDRVDLKADARAAGVLDFKSGKYRQNDFINEFGGAGIEARKKVQDLVYSIAIRKLFPTVETTEVSFAYISNGTETQFAKAAWVSQPEVDLGTILEKLSKAESGRLFRISHRSSIGYQTYCEICKRLGWVAEQLRLEQSPNSETVGSDDD